jgi:hypothetical protein
VHPRPWRQRTGGESLAVANPLGIESLGPVLSTVLIGVNGLAVPLAVLLAAVLRVPGGPLPAGGARVRW